MRLVLACLFCLSLSALAADEEKHDLKFKKTAQGAVFAVVDADKTLSKTVVTVDGKVAKETKEDVVENYTYTEEVLAKEATKATTKLSRKYDKATVAVEGKERSRAGAAAVQL